MAAHMNLAEEIGTHLADVDKALAFRRERLDRLGNDTAITLDFTGVRHSNSSFVNGLLTGLIEEHGEALLSRITFRGCNPLLKVLVEGAIALGLEKHDRHAKA